MLRAFPGFVLRVGWAVLFFARREGVENLNIHHQDSIIPKPFVQSGEGSKIIAAHPPLRTKSGKTLNR
jgi:hypothetical protein